MFNEFNALIREKKSGDYMVERREYYSSSIKSFLKLNDDVILEQLLINDEFETTDL